MTASSGGIAQFLFAHRAQRETKNGPAARIGLGRDLAAVGFDDGPRQRQPHAHALALGRWFLKLPGPRTMVQDAKRFICSSLLVRAFVSVGHPTVAKEPRYVVPRDFESAAGFEVVNAAPG